MVIGDLDNVGDFLSNKVVVDVLEGEDDPVANRRLVFLVSTVTCDSHDEFNLFCIERMLQILLHVLPSLELLFVDHDDAIVLVAVPLFLLVGIALLLAIVSLGLALFAAFANNDSATILWVRLVALVDLGDGGSDGASWGGFGAPSTSIGALQPLFGFHCCGKDKGK